MAARAEVLVFSCSEDDLAELRAASGPGGPPVRAVETPTELALDSITRNPAAVVVGVGIETLSRLDMLPVIQAVRKGLPVIVVAEDDSLALERRVREKEIFYYLVHPIDRPEAEAVLQDVMRRAEGRR